MCVQVCIQVVWETAAAAALSADGDNYLPDRGFWRSTSKSQGESKTSVIKSNRFYFKYLLIQNTFYGFYVYKYCPYECNIKENYDIFSPIEIIYRYLNVLFLRILCFLWNFYCLMISLFLNKRNFSDKIFNCSFICIASWQIWNIKKKLHLIEKLRYCWQNRESFHIVCSPYNNYHHYFHLYTMCVCVWVFVCMGVCECVCVCVLWLIVLLWGYDLQPDLCDPLRSISRIFPCGPPFCLKINNEATL